MTTDDESVSDDRLREIIAGCEGVTPGPWTYGSQWLCAKRGQSYLNLAQVPLNDYDSPRWNADMAHVARLDPQTVTAICSELLSRRSPPSGYRLVPEEPTEAMIGAGVNEAHRQGGGYAASAIYTAMLAAAPTPKSTEGK